MPQSDEQITYAAYVKESTDHHQEVLPFGRWKTWVQLPEALRS